MSKQKDKIGSGDILRPQVIVVDMPEKPGARIADPLAPRIIKTAQIGRIIPTPPTELQRAVEPGRRRYGLSMKLAVAGLLLAFCGWLNIHPPRHLPTTLRTGHPMLMSRRSP